MSSHNSFFFFKKRLSFQHQEKNNNKMFLLDFLLLFLQNKYGNITNNHLESKVTYLETSGLKSHPWIKWRMKDYSETTELEKTLLSDSFIGFFHSRRDQMNSGKKRRNADHQKSSLLRNSLCSLASLCFVPQLS